MSPSAKPPAVTVVVPTVDRVALLERCLRGLAQQTVTDMEVVVVHDGNPGIVALLDSWAGRLPLRPLQIDRPGASDKRNAGWRSSAAELIAFTDDDCEPTPSWLAELCAAAGAGVGIVAGPVAPHPEDSGVGGLWARTVHSSAPGLYPGCNLAFPRSVLEQVGGFDPELTAGEDTDLAWRVRESGAGASWASGALVWHAVRAVDLPAQLRSLPRWSTLPLVARRHPQLRAEFAHRRWFWKDSHPAACAALAGLALMPLDRRTSLLVAPVLARRIRAAGARDGLALALNDIAEAAVMVYGSLRHRSVLL